MIAARDAIQDEAYRRAARFAHAFHGTETPLAAPIAFLMAAKPSLWMR